jgi:hypothetical protein
LDPDFVHELRIHMPNYTHDFDDSTIGTVVPTGFTSRWVATTRWAVEGSAPSRYFQRTLTEGSAARYFVSMDSVNGDSARDQAEILMRMRISGPMLQAVTLGAVIRGSGSATSETGYATARYGDVLRLIRYSGGVVATLNNSPTLSPAIASSAWTWLRFRVSGFTNPLLQAKIWEDTGTLFPDGEPSSWTVEFTDNVAPITAPGWVGPFFPGGSQDLDIAEIAIATGGGIAGFTPETTNRGRLLMLGIG